jgi:hypothetical protein
MSGKEGDEGGAKVAGVATAQNATQELEKVRHALDEAEEQLSEDPDLDEWDVVEEEMKKIGLKLVDEDYLVEKFGLSDDEAVDALYWYRYWDTCISGSFGGIDIYYSPRSKLYYAISGEWFKSSESYALYVKQLTDEQLLKLLGGGE